MITLAELRLRSKQAADMENSQFVSETEWNYYISNSYAELYDLLVGKFEDYYIAEPLIVTISGTDSSFPLPDDFYKMRGLDRSLGGGEFYTLHPFSFERRNRRAIVDVYRGVFPLVQYRILGSDVIVSPDDQAAGQYRLWYIPKYSQLVDDADEVDGVNGWEEYIIVDAAIKALRKEESDVSVHMAQKQALIARIEAIAANRDAGETEKVTDVNSTNTDDPLFYRW